jgi:hypothetical protein
MTHPYDQYLLNQAEAQFSAEEHAQRAQNETERLEFEEDAVLQGDYSLSTAR